MIDMIDFNINNNNNNSEDYGYKIEYKLFNSIKSDLGLELILECMVSAGSIDEQQSNSITMDQAISTLLDHVRELGIECFIRRLSEDVLYECCSLLSLTASNSDNIELAQQQLESTFKSDSLSNIFHNLTTHILKRFCQCLGIIDKNINNNNNSNNNNNINNNNNTTKSNILVTSTPNIQILDNTAVITTHTTKSSFHQYSNNSKPNADDAVIDNSNFRNIVTLLIDEITLSGLENLFYLQSKSTLENLYKTLEIKGEYPNRIKDVITKLTFRIFNRDLAIQDGTLTPKSSSSEREDNGGSSAVRVGNKSKATTTNITATPTANTTTDQKEEYNIRNEDDSGDDDDYWSSPTIPTTQIDFKRVIEAGEQTDEEDKDIDTPPEKRPTIKDIKEGVTKDTLERMFVKDLRNWLKSKKLKYSERKNLLVSRILKTLEGEIATEESEVETSAAEKRKKDTPATGRKIKKAKS
ncbi:SAP DNA-binding domain-containing protein [Heterostelium album PN500]|uniref:SAP DNA-binding domain-containing protein n=1 Tax=Heterostelium pallidum (strain ATCC 26659 / Pp 5 / PN500) TaxID=670386 RepID=D3B079_HETP5|nr:SAP DNA-binding domain-containing protein [Heterostelium album PN500]EFA84703.1 SAP DNA-binding domain-containing protein [Heterostelium album PN500]|eukprot:XP_020436816.1 SAP DNA-binding domain-containing protein [Heterostelium album PN500]